MTKLMTPSGELALPWTAEEEAALKPYLVAYFRGAYASRMAFARAAAADTQLQNRSVRSIESYSRRAEAHTPGHENGDWNNDDLAAPPPKHQRVPTAAGWTQARVRPPAAAVAAKPRGRSSRTFRGVYITVTGQFEAAIMQDGEWHHVDTFDDEVDAACAFDKCVWPHCMHLICAGD